MMGRVVALMATLTNRPASEILRAYRGREEELGFDLAVFAAGLEAQRWASEGGLSLERMAKDPSILEEYERRKANQGREVA